MQRYFLSNTLFFVTCKLYVYNIFTQAIKQIFTSNLNYNWHLIDKIWPETVPSKYWQLIGWQISSLCSDWFKVCWRCHSDGRTVKKSSVNCQKKSVIVYILKCCYNWQLSHIKLSKDQTQNKSVSILEQL